MFILNANILIYLLEAVPKYKNILDELITSIDQKILNTITSELTLLEGLTKPLSENRNGLVSVYLNQIQSTDGFSVIPIDRNVLIEAAKVRVLEKLKAPDAIHVATARLFNCDGFLTNDRHLSNIKSPQSFILDDLPIT